MLCLNDCCYFVSVDLFDRHSYIVQELQNFDRPVNKQYAYGIHVDGWYSMYTCICIGRIKLNIFLKLGLVYKLHMTYITLATQSKNNAENVQSY